MSEREEKQLVTMATTSGPVEVEAEVYGVWALTPCNVEGGGTNDDFWAFTHVPTGRSYGRAAFANKAEVREFIKTLAREFSDGAWLESDPYRLVGALSESERLRFTALYNEFRSGDFYASTTESGR